MRLQIALLGALSTTIGQSLLLTLLLPGMMAIYGSWILLGLLVFNLGLAWLVMYRYDI